MVSSLCFGQHFNRAIYDSAYDRPGTLLKTEDALYYSADTKEGVALTKLDDNGSTVKTYRTPADSTLRRSYFNHSGLIKISDSVLFEYSRRYESYLPQGKDSSRFATFDLDLNPLKTIAVADSSHHTFATQQFLKLSGERLFILKTLEFVVVDRNLNVLTHFKDTVANRVFLDAVHLGADSILVKTLAGPGYLIVDLANQKFDSTAITNDWPADRLADYSDSTFLIYSNADSLLYETRKKDLQILDTIDIDSICGQNINHLRVFENGGIIVSNGVSPHFWLNRNTFQILRQEQIFAPSFDWQDSSIFIRTGLSECRQADIEAFPISGQRAAKFGNVSLRVANFQAQLLGVIDSTRNFLEPTYRVKADADVWVKNNSSNMLDSFVMAYYSYDGSNNPFQDAIQNCRRKAVHNLALVSSDSVLVSTSDTFLYRVAPSRPLAVNVRFFPAVANGNIISNRKYEDGHFYFSNIGIDEFRRNESIAIYPNPVLNILHLRIPEDSELKSYAIFSTTGQKILSAKGEGLTGEISVERLKAGTYILQLETDKGFHSGRFVKR